MRSSSPRIRTTRWLALAVVSILTLGAVGSGQVTAQSALDAPPLGFEIDSDTGPVGATVNGLVDTDDIAEHCITDPIDFIGQFIDVGGGEQQPPYWMALEEWTRVNDVDDIIGLEGPLGLAARIAVLFPLGLAIDFDSSEPKGLTEAAMEGTFIMGFADLATQRPIAPYGSFDPETGEGSTVVPDLRGGTHPVIATCVGIPDDVTADDIDAMFEAGAAYIAENISEPYPSDPLGPGADEFAAVAGEVAPVMLESLVEPKALGIEFYCVDDGEGSCDEPQEPETPEEPETPTEPESPTDPGGAAPADPIPSAPSYTG